MNQKDGFIGVDGVGNLPRRQQGVAPFSGFLVHRAEQVRVKLRESALRHPADAAVAAVDFAGYGGEILAQLQPFPHRFRHGIGVDADADGLQLNLRGLCRQGGQHPGE